MSGSALATLASGQSGQSGKVVTTWLSGVQSLREQSDRLPKQSNHLDKWFSCLWKCCYCFQILFRSACRTQGLFMVLLLIQHAWNNHLIRYGLTSTSSSFALMIGHDDNLGVKHPFALRNERGGFTTYLVHFIPRLWLSSCRGGSGSGRGCPCSARRAMARVRSLEVVGPSKGCTPLPAAFYIYYLE